MNKQAKEIQEGFDYFGSGGCNTPQFENFYKRFCTAFRKEMKRIGVTQIKFSKGHFYLSGFFIYKRSVVYFKLSDVRSAFYQEPQLLVRTAKDFKDYTGGVNTYIKIKAGMSSEIARKFSKPPQHTPLYECKYAIKNGFYAMEGVDMPTNDEETIKAILCADGWKVIEVYDIKLQDDPSNMVMGA